MKTAIALIIFAASACAQTTPVTVTFTFPNAAIADVMTWNRGQLNDPATTTTLTQDIDNAASTLNVGSTAAYGATGSIVIDSEELAYTGKTSTTFTGVTRGKRTSTAASHVTGTAIHVERYPDNPSLVKAMVLPFVQGIIQQQGTSSTYLTSLAQAQATANAAVVTALSTTVQ